MATPVEHFQAVADAGHTTAQVGGGITILGWVTSSQGIGILGLVIGVFGLLIQWYYRRKQDRREEEEHRLRMARIGGGDS